MSVQQLESGSRSWTQLRPLVSCARQGSISQGTVFPRSPCSLVSESSVLGCSAGTWACERKEKAGGCFSHSFCASCDVLCSSHLPFVVHSHWATLAVILCLVGQLQLLAISFLPFISPDLGMAATPSSPFCANPWSLFCLFDFSLHPSAAHSSPCVKLPLLKRSRVTLLFSWPDPEGHSRVRCLKSV